MNLPTLSWRAWSVRAGLKQKFKRVVIDKFCVGQWDHVMKVSYGGALGLIKELKYCYFNFSINLVEFERHVGLLVLHGSVKPINLI